MSIKLRLTLMNFLQFFVWGSWLITIGTYCFNAKGWTGAQFGAIFSTLALSSLFMPALTGIIADKWMNAERLYGVLHILYGVILFYVPYVNDPDTLFYVIFAAMICYMPTISLTNTISYSILKRNDYDVVKVFPPIRVWGTIGFIVAMWITNLSGSKANSNQFIIAASFAIALGVYAFTLPKCPPQRTISKGASIIELLGLNAFKLFGNLKMALFFFFAMFLGAALQLTNMYGDTFITDFGGVSPYNEILNNFQNVFLPHLKELSGFFDKISYIFTYHDLIPALMIKYSTITMSISQISETLFILSIPFFLKRFGIKKVMLFSMIAWVLRFGLFSFGNPSPELFWMIILSCIVYGMAFDFFNISGSLFIETTTDSKIRASAQGLFMMMTNGFGAFLGSKISGYIIDHYYVTSAGKNWHGIWLSFAIYALVVALLFMLFFRHKHDPKNMANIQH